MEYAEALAVLERACAFGINPTLEGVTELLDALGRPQEAFASVQIAGTNGKTSTARVTAAVLLGEGTRVGLFTSPHLIRYPERIEIDGAPVTDAEFARGIAAALGSAERLRGVGSTGTADGFTEFELLTAAAVWLFREHDVEIAVLEVGLGGKWDATSVVSPSVAVITGIALDHTAILGNTVEEIAADKAAIIKPASTPVLGPGTEGLDAVFLRRADELDLHARAVREDVEFSPVSEDLTIRFRVAERSSAPGGLTALDVDGVHTRYEALRLAAPSYQAANVATAIAAAEAALGRALDPARIRAALATLTLPGRFELMRAAPPVIVDGSHNPAAAAVLAVAIREAFPDPHCRPALLLGILADKDAAGIVRALAPVASVAAVVRLASQRALDVDELAAIVERQTGTRPPTFDSVAEGLSASMRTSACGLVVTGSLVTAGEARRWLLDGSETPEM